MLQNKSFIFNLMKKHLSRHLNLRPLEAKSAKNVTMVHIPIFFSFLSI